MKKNILSFLLFIFCVSAFAENVANNSKSDLSISVQGYQLQVKYYSPDIVRVTKLIKNSDKGVSLSVIMSPNQVNLKKTEDGSKVILESSSVVTKIDTLTGKVTFFNKKSLLLTEKDYGTQFTPVKYGKYSTYDVRQAFMLNQKEAIYGLGQHLNGKMNQRNQKLFLRNANMSVCLPWFVSVKGYGLFWDNYSPTTFTDNLQETSFDSQSSDRVVYYFINGGNIDGVIKNLRQLTGKAPMLPLWAFGYIQSKERYKTQDELVGVVKKYRDLKVPLDCIVQDWQYWGRDSSWNAMSFDKDRYPDPDGMVKAIHKLNAKLMIVAWPGFGPKTELYKEYKKQNMLLPFTTWPTHDGVTVYDAYNPVARDMYWKKLNAGVFSKNIDAWWLDSTEPDHFNIQEKDFNIPTYLGSYRSVVNAFPLMTVGGVYTHQRKTTADKRVCILTRSAFIGQQRYAANTWSGDVTSSWKSFRQQIAGGLNFTMSGLPYWNADIGGFFAGSWGKDGGTKSKAFQELYLRWLEFGTFTPMMRSHGTGLPREVYQFGKAGDTVYDGIVKMINLRYSLLPYIYSTAWSVTKNSSSIIRSLVFDYPNDKKVYDINDEYLFGNSILVAPIMYPSAVSRKVYLPKGEWYYLGGHENFKDIKYIKDCKVIEGNSDFDYDAPLNVIPIFAKAGSILPIGPEVQYSSEKKWDDLKLYIFPGKDGKFVLYEDEGDNYDYEDGKYSEINFVWNDNKNELTIEDRNGEFKGMLSKRRFELFLVGTKIHKSVSYKGHKLLIKINR